MKKERYSAEYLRRLRNDIPMARLLRELQWPNKHRDGELRFMCPRCQFTHTGINPKTNLGRCFRCKENFNTIEFVMEAEEWDFLMAIPYLDRMLPTQNTNQD